MLIMIFVGHAGSGGAEMNAIRLASQLALTGDRVEFVATRGGGGYERLLPSCVTVTHLHPGAILGSSTATYLASVWRLRRVISQSRPDMVISFLDIANVTLLAATRVMTDRPRIVLGVQNNLAHSFGRGSLGAAVRWCAQRWYPHADRIVALSDGVADQVREFLRTGAERVTMVPNIGVTDEVRDQVARPVDVPASHRPLVVACGRLVPQKSYPDLLHAVKGVMRRRAMTLRVLGIGPLEGELRGLAQRLGIADRLEFAGFVDEPVRHMAAADLFVLSSRWEGFGNVLVEAMAAGTPVVSTDCPFGPKQIIDDSDAGVLVPMGDVGALADAIDALLADSDRRRVMGKAARVRSECFSAEAIANQWRRDVFEGLMQSRKRDPGEAAA